MVSEGNTRALYYSLPPAGYPEVQPVDDLGMHPMTYRAVTVFPLNMVGDIKLPETYTGVLWELINEEDSRMPFVITIEELPFHLILTEDMGDLIEEAEQTILDDANLWINIVGKNAEGEEEEWQERLRQILKINNLKL